MKRCFGCEQENPDNLTFCGFCGSPLKLGDFLSRKVSEQLSATIRDRSVMETESSIKVFEKAWGWVRTVLSIVAVLVAILGAGILWKASDLWSSVDKAKQAVQATADASKQQIQQSSANSVQTINTAANSATNASTNASAEIDKQSKAATHETAQLKSEVGHTRTDLKRPTSCVPK
jgi:cytoskeletal protein RodZ